MKYSILMTVFDREPEVLLAVFRSLAQCDMTDCELVVVNDRSHLDYRFVRWYLSEKFEHGGWHDMEPYEAFRLEDGTNNPARAFNKAVQLSQGENLILMSSDVIVPPRTMARIRKVDLGETLWTPYVEDTHGDFRSSEYCGPKRLFPMPWFLGCSRRSMLAVRGWDETYLGGLCFEDNDMVGRLVLETGRFMGDWNVKVFHLGHHQVAYQYKDPEVSAANSRNRELTLSKWTGIPFDGEYSPFDVTRKMHPSGNVTHECRRKDDLLGRLVDTTTGLLAEDHVPAG